MGTSWGHGVHSSVHHLGRKYTYLSVYARITKRTTWCSADLEWGHFSRLVSMMQPLFMKAKWGHLSSLHSTQPVITHQTKYG